MKTRIKLSILFILLSWSATAQIVDDTTKLVYGATSTRWISVNDLKHNDTLFHTMDTSLYNLEAFQVKKNQDRRYYDLGNNGTALTPIYYDIPENVGRNTGFHAYDPYVKTVEDFKYYDTKSPYIMLGVVFGGSGRAKVDFEFARNINPQWNVGFNIYRISSNKQLGSASLREKQILSSTSDFYTYYHTKNKKYHIMFHVLKFEHQATETGGILFDTPVDDYFLYKDSDINLVTANTEDERNRMYVYQQYSVKPYFEIYSTVERNKKINRFNDPSVNSGYYDHLLIRTDSTLDASSFLEWKVQAGIKGRVADRIFYSGYVKRRDIDVKGNYINPFAHTSENYLGGDIKLLITKTNEVGGRGEVADGGQYYLTGYFKNNFLTGSYTSSQYRPSFLVERYFGNHYEWNNSFNSTFANSIKGSVFYKFPFLRIAPKIEITSINNYIYFDSDRAPAQNNGALFINKYSVDADFNIGEHIHFENNLVFNNISGDNAQVMRAPDWNYFGKWYYENIFFNDGMEMQAGFDLRWQSAFFGNAYDPITQQFYLQNDLEVGSYFSSDIFFTIKSNDLTLFFKLNYLNQQREGGYFEVPYYPGMRRVFDMGLRWMFFD